MFTMSTIKDVAALANVSIATVSRVLNGNATVSPELVLRVQAAVEKLSYQPNKLARSLRRNESATVGVLIPDSSNPFFAELAKGVEDACFSEGFNVVLCNTNEDPAKAQVHLANLTEHRIAGFVVVSPDKLERRLQRLLDEAYLIVLADRPFPNLETDSVVADNYGGARRAVQHLLDLGHRRIGFVAGSATLGTVQERWRGVEEALRAAGLRPSPELIYNSGEYEPESGYAGAEVLLRQADPPTAIFAFNDLMALGILHYTHVHGIRVPDELSVVGFDNISIAAFLVPGLTTVAQPRYELGRRAAQILLRRIEGNREPPSNLVLPTELVVRASTSAPLNRF
ncbi:MAG: LacI family DNA-binding transcriptional regulator [Caldilineaceae bacterium]|nr:LacI family DNA-binding transcriptional regulator [Caldilineaceae bacterium]